MSEDLSLFTKVNRVKEIYISENFEDLFTVQEKLGEGAQSVVKKCVEVASGKTYAVKLFRSCDAELIEMLKAQYKILIDLSHPNVIEGYYLFINEKAMCCQMVIEYSASQALSQVLSKAPLTMEESVSLVSKLVQAVAYLHGNGVCHRDVKP